MRSPLPLLLTITLAGCATSPDEAGFADVVGQVFHASGAPVVAPTVSVSCSGRALVMTTGDSLGHYQVALESVAGRHHCTFVANGAGPVPIQRDTTIGFAPPGLHPLQYVDLRETITP